MGLKKVREIFGSTPDILDESQTACLNMIFSYDGTKRSVVMYPCRNFELLNFVCIVPDESLRSPTTESWTAGGDRDELLSLFNDFPSWVSQYFE
jgi:salicylate hydroxylase